MPIRAFLSGAALWVCVASGAVSGAAHAAAEKPKIAVLDVSAEGTERRLARVVNDVVLLELSHDSAFEVIGSADIEAMLGMERQKQLLGCSDASSSCLAELSGALGARYLVTGSLTQLGKKLRLDMRLLDTTTAKAVTREAGSVTSEEALEGEARRIALALLAAAHKASPLPSGEGTANREGAVASTGHGTKTTAGATTQSTSSGATNATTSASSAASTTTGDATTETSTTAPAPGRRVWPWGVAGAGVIVAGIGGYLAYDASTFTPIGKTFDVARNELHAKQQQSVVGYSLAGVGAAAAIAGIVLALQPVHEESATVAVVPTRGGFAAGVGGSF